MDDQKFYEKLKLETVTKILPAVYDACESQKYFEKASIRIARDDFVTDEQQVSTINNFLILVKAIDFSQKQQKLKSMLNHYAKPLAFYCVRLCFFTLPKCTNFTFKIVKKQY
jgi:hypothetical protein